MKNEIRKKYLLVRKMINNKSEKDNIIYNKVINNKQVIDSEQVLIYVSMKEEIDTRRLINYFLMNKRVAVPRVEGNIINFYYIRSMNDLCEGTYNILEPRGNDMVVDFNKTVAITPLICYSLSGYRIGYGKGYYDRFYQKNNVYKIGLGYKECLVENINNNEYDIKMDEIITD